MTDANLNIADLIAAGDEELMFDDDAFAAEPAPEPVKPRRAKRRGRAVAEDAASPAPATADMMAVAQASPEEIPAKTRRSHLPQGVRIRRHH